MVLAKLTADYESRDENLAFMKWLKLAKGLVFNKHVLSVSLTFVPAIPFYLIFACDYP